MLWSFLLDYDYLQSCAEEGQSCYLNWSRANQSTTWTICETGCRKVATWTCRDCEYYLIHFSVVITKSRLMVLFEPSLFNRPSHVLWPVFCDIYTSSYVITKLLKVSLTTLLSFFFSLSVQSYCLLTPLRDCLSPLFPCLRSIPYNIPFTQTNTPGATSNLDGGK